MIDIGLVTTILLIVAAVSFGLKSINVRVGTLDLVAFGLFAWVLTDVIPRFFK